MENVQLPEEMSKTPANLEVEYALIGWVFADNRGMAELSKITPDDFHSKQHADAWQAMEILFRKGESITPFTVNPLLKAPALFADAGGPIKYLTGSLSASLLYPFPKDIEPYLIRLAQQRDIATACNQVLGSEGSPIESAAILSRMAGRISNSSPLDEFEDNHQTTETIISELKDARKPNPTGLPRLDGAMGGGLYPGKSYGFAARKKHGKTTLAATISHNLNVSGVKHLFICGEMSPGEIQQRVIARVTDSFSSAFKSGYGESDAFYKKMQNYLAETPKNVLYKNAPGITFDELKRICTVAVEHHSIKGIILDYWQLVGGKQKGQSTAEHLDDVAQWISDYSRKCGTWSIVMAQINQEGNTRGGEGMRLSFDQVYSLQAPGDDPTRSDRWLDMMETRYTVWKSVGTKESPAYLLNEKGPYFEEQKA